MKEAGDVTMNKMKEKGGTENFKEMFQSMTKSMGLGKNVKLDQKGRSSADPIPTDPTLIPH